MVTPAQYLRTSYPDGDREYIDGAVVERNIGEVGHSRLLGLLCVYLAEQAKSLGLAVRPSCRLRIAETRYRVPDMTVMQRPYKANDGSLTGLPFLVVEILATEDTMQETLWRLADYERLGATHTLLMDPDDCATWTWSHGLIGGDIEGFDVAARGFLRLNSGELRARLLEDRD